MKAMKLARRLHSARIAQHLSLRDVERLSGHKISNAYVSHLELANAICPYPDKLRILAKVLKLDFMELMILAGHITVQDLKGRI